MELASSTAMPADSTSVTRSAASAKVVPPLPDEALFMLPVWEREVVEVNNGKEIIDRILQQRGMMPGNWRHWTEMDINRILQQRRMMPGNLRHWTEMDIDRILQHRGMMPGNLRH